MDISKSQRDIKVEDLVNQVFAPSALMAGFVSGLCDRIDALESRIKKLEEMNNGKD